MTDYSENREEFWKNIDSDYYEKNTANHIDRRVFFAGLMHKNNIKSVLELGCNSGGNLLRILRANKNIKAVGLDICEKAIQYGKEKEHNLADLQVGSIYDLDRFDDKSFDVVFTMGTLLHVNLDRIYDVIKNMIRISRRNVINIERNGEDKVLSYGHNNEEHAFSHNFVKIYNSFGFIPHITKVDKLIINSHQYKSGGADHFIWANLKGKFIFFKKGEILYTGRHKE